MLDKELVSESLGYKPLPEAINGRAAMLGEECPALPNGEATIYIGVYIPGGVYPPPGIYVLWHICQRCYQRECGRPIYGMD